MKSIGIFRKVEMDEKSYLVYTLTQTNNPTSSRAAAIDDYDGDNLPFQPLFICPAARLRFLEIKSKSEGTYYNRRLHPLNASPFFPTNDHQQDQSLLDCDSDDICKLPVVPLFWCNNKEPDSEEYECNACETSMFSTSYYVCLQCHKKFHKECVESPLEIIHPSHPFHPLQLYAHRTHVKSFCCDTSLTKMSYHCTICDLSMHPICEMKTVPIVIDHPKSHAHPLTFFPRQASLACNICGLTKNLDPTYICTQCVFVAHRDCIGFPHVIRISRHDHRIYFTTSLPSGVLSCGVCHRQVDNSYGAYSCNKCDSYHVHSRCALHENVWDGKDLDGVSEKDDIIDDGEPFVRLADGKILHPCHSHPLRLDDNKVYDERDFCRGCALPIYEGKFYSCIECDFMLHEICADAPRMKRHPLHPHPLTLNFGTKGYSHCKGVFFCSICERRGSGFVYEYHRGDISFQLDLRCALVTEPFEYQGHKHSLFF